MPQRQQPPTKGISHWFLWLENNPMNFDGSKTDFGNATVTGSESENQSQTLHKGIDSLPREERLKKEVESVNKYPSSIVSANILSVYSTTWGKENTKEVFDRFSTENKTSEYGQKSAKYIKLNKDPKSSEKFVDFEMVDPKGKPNHRISPLKTVSKKEK
ncbi:hypothetical protein [Pricia sp.]|uniref:hypothetical protein n=1 Tax=Pricia sp. TaxID=2268138 RepID=UPI003593F41B